MDSYVLLAVLLALIGRCSAAETLEATFSDGTSSLKLNKAERAEIKCVIKSTSPPLANHQHKWYKEQVVDDWVLVGDSEEEKAPFNNENKFTITFELTHHDESTGEAESLYTLTINDVGRSDAGNYRCASGKRNAELQNSNSAQLFISPDETAPQLTTTALEKGSGVYKFNLTNEVSCQSAVLSSSADLKLAMFVNGEPAGPEFKVGVTVISWEGSTAGLKVPTTSLTIQNPSWQPSDFGKSSVRCQFMDGERSLGSAEFTAVKDEPPIEATVGCYSNYGSKRARRGDTDLAIICTASNTEKVEDLYIQFEFYNKDKVIVLQSGEQAYGRVAKNDPADPQKFRLEIPKVIREVVVLGQQIYNVSLHGTIKGVEQELDFIEFILPVDGTSRIGSGAQIATPLTALLLFSIFVSFL